MQTGTKKQFAYTWPIYKLGLGMIEMCVTQLRWTQLSTPIQCDGVTMDLQNHFSYSVLQTLNFQLYGPGQIFFNS